MNVFIFLDFLLSPLLLLLLQLKLLLETQVKAFLLKRVHDCPANFIIQKHPRLVQLQLFGGFPNQFLHFSVDILMVLEEDVHDGHQIAECVFHEPFRVDV
jgi:hypothetical protein